MELKWQYDIKIKKAYEAVVWEDGNTLLLDKCYTTKAEAFKTVKKFKKSYKGKGKLDCYVRFFDFYNVTVQDFNL